MLDEVSFGVWKGGGAAQTKEIDTFRVVGRSEQSASEIGDPALGSTGGLKQVAKEDNKGTVSL